MTSSTLEMPYIDVMDTRNMWVQTDPQIIERLIRLEEMVKALTEALEAERKAR